MIATTSPTTTGNSAMPVLMMLKRKERPRKFPNASPVPKGKPIRRLITVAMAKLVWIERFARFQDQRAWCEYKVNK
jgi:hypothetical protein